MKFYLGTHQPLWLGKVEFPLCVSRRVIARRLAGKRRVPRAKCDWILDSGGFTELQLHGEWRLSAADYVAEVRLFSDMIGEPDWAAPQDWMCEPFMLAKTGLSMARHQELTIDNYLELRSMAPELPFIPVLQGWEYEDYLDHAVQYVSRGVDLIQEPVIGIGSVCRRQRTGAAASIIYRLARQGLKLHGFGFKIIGLRKVSGSLVSADSSAWSFAAGKSPPLPGHEARHKHCSNCMEYAMQWRDHVMETIERGYL